MRLVAALVSCLACVAFPLGAARGQDVEITSVPAYGDNGSMRGRVSGVEPAAHHVAPYIHIEGLGWWTKPSFASPTVAIAADGTF